MIHTTIIQYKLLKTCFMNGAGTILTAVGDEKQRIMVWAGADREIFKKFREDSEAQEKSLLLNHRSAPRLVAIQKVFVEKIFKKSLDVKADGKRWNAEDGTCQIWSFESSDQEARVIASKIENWFSNEKLQPRDVCIIVRQLPDRYGHPLIDTLAELGISARNENEFQDLLSEECNRVILDFTTLAFAEREPDACVNTMQILNRVRGIDPSFEEHESLRRGVRDLSQFLENLKMAVQSVTNAKELERVIYETILGYLDLTAFRNLFPQYQRGNYLEQQVKGISKLLWAEYHKRRAWDKTVESVLGKYSIPVMTIHKSKGLEYNTVIFVGLEDDAFWSFSKEQDSESCAFFVALSRAKRRAIFTFSNIRSTGPNGMIKNQTRNQIGSLYEVLENSGVVDIIDFTVREEEQ